MFRSHCLNLPARALQLLMALLLSAAPLVVRADTESFGNWMVGTIEGGEGYFAATVNDSNAVLGQYCYLESGDCLWLLATSTNCEDGERYPVLVNADGGSAQLELVCRKLGKKPRYIFSNFESIDKSIRNSGKYIGFAFPLQSGLFQVDRFLLDGAVESLVRMRAVAKGGTRKKGGGGGSSTKSYKL
jgi:hypothetical protein